MQGAQLCQHNCTIPTKSLKTWEYLGRGASLLSDVRLKILCSNQKEKEKTKLKPINKQIPKQKLQKTQIALRFNSNWVFSIALLFIPFLSSFWAVFYVSLNMAAVLTVWTLITDQLRDTLALPPSLPHYATKELNRKLFALSMQHVIAVC